MAIRMTLKQTCPYCNTPTIAKRILGFYVGSDKQVKLWECRNCLAIWSNKGVGA
jgi:Zn-finger protein